MTISVCMLTKNDGATITKALDSVKSIAHEVIIVDTGSKDNTLQQIAEFEQKHNIPCKVINHIWDNNFSKARNTAIKRATGKWILMMEPTEQLERNDQRKVKELTMDSQYLGYYMHRLVAADSPDMDTLLHISRNSLKLKKHTFIPELRLFQNSEMIKYAGVIYESVEASLHKLGPSLKTNIRFG